MASGIQEDGLRGGVNATRRRQRGIEGNRDVDIEFIFYLFCAIGVVVQHDDGKRYPVAVFSHQRFEIGHVETGAGAVWIEEMEEHRSIGANRQFAGQIDIGAHRDRAVSRRDGSGQAVSPVGIPEDTSHAAERNE